MDPAHRRSRSPPLVLAARARRSPCHGSSASGLIVGGGGAGLHARVAAAFAGLGDGAGLHRGGAGLHRDGAGLRDDAGFLAAGRFYMRSSSSYNRTLRSNTTSAM